MQKFGFWLLLLFIVVLGLDNTNAETIVDSGGNGDYVTIDEALQSAVEGDTILVWDGVYSGNFNISVDDIQLIGNGSTTTTIQGNDPNANNIVIVADNIRISNFMITGADSAISITDSMNCRISGNNITGNKRGIHMSGSASYNTIEGNIITGNTFNGVYLESTDLYNYTAHSNIITGNSISSTTTAIWIKGTSDTEISNNVIHSFGTYGIQIQSSIRDSLINNTITDGNYGITLYGGYNQIISQNTIFSLDGYGIFVNSGQLMDTEYNESVYIGKLMIDDNDIYSCAGGIKITASMDNDVVNNRIYDNIYGLELISPGGNRISNNNFSDNERGLFLSMTSAVVVANNTFRDNWYGIFVWFSSGNQINENLLSRNNIGIYLNNASYVNLINGNNISSNQEYGVYSEINVNATSNYWGDPSGPYNQMHNPSGMGDKVSDNVDFQHWTGFNPGEASEYVETESKPLIPLDWRTGLLVSIFAITNYTVSQWIVKWARVPVDRIAKWVTDKEKKKK